MTTPITKATPPDCEALKLIDEQLYGICKDIVAVEEKTYRNSDAKNQDITVLVQKGLERADQINIETDQQDNFFARASADEAYGLAKDDLLTFDELMHTTKNDASTPYFDPAPFFDHYITANTNYLAGGCNISDEMTVRQDDDLKEVYVDQRTGEHNCLLLSELDDEVHNLAGMTSYAPVSQTARFAPDLQASQIYLRVGIDPLTMRETAYPGTQSANNYSMIDLSAGWYLPLSENPLLPHVPFGGPQLELNYSHVTGDIGTLGSTRDQVGLRLGYKQPLYEFATGQIKVSPYLDPAASLGVADNKLNFGQGYIPETQYSLTGGLDLVGGVQACVENLGCVSSFAGYHLDQTLLGAPNDHAYGFTAGGILAIQLPEFKSKSVNKESGDTK